MSLPDHLSLSPKSTASLPAFEVEDPTPRIEETDPFRFDSVSPFKSNEETVSRTGSEKKSNKNKNKNSVSQRLLYTPSPPIHTLLPLSKRSIL